MSGNSTYVDALMLINMRYFIDEVASESLDPHVVKTVERGFLHFIRLLERCGCPFPDAVGPCVPQPIQETGKYYYTPMPVQNQSYDFAPTSIQTSVQTSASTYPQETRNIPDKAQSRKKTKQKRRIPAEFKVERAFDRENYNYPGQFQMAKQTKQEGYFHPGQTVEFHQGPKIESSSSASFGININTIDGTAEIVELDKVKSETPRPQTKGNEDIEVRRRSNSLPGSTRSEFGIKLH